MNLRESLKTLILSEYRNTILELKLLKYLEDSIEFYNEIVEEKVDNTQNYGQIYDNIYYMKEKVELYARKSWRLKYKNDGERRNKIISIQQLYFIASNILQDIQNEIKSMKNIQKNS
ncbi:MAG: hypothetical protein QW727_01010 [Candidatus Pacearchaeota archaeon]